MNKDSKNTKKFKLWCNCNKKSYDIVSGVRVKDWRQYKDMLTPYAYYNLHNWRPSTQHFDTTGPIGCFLAHKKVWDICVQRNESVWIFEEGVYEYKDAMFDILDSQYKSVDLIFGHTINLFHVWKQHKICTQSNIDDYLTDIDKIYYGTKCYRVSPLFANLLLQQSKQFELHVDSYINVLAIYYKDNESLRMYRTKSNIVSARSSWEINHSIDYSIFIPCIAFLIIIIMIIQICINQRKYRKQLLLLQN
jgi:GR25 family glycosyltransferase involved in LPS biosynthesis